VGLADGEDRGMASEARIVIRGESQEDGEAIRALLNSAFGGSAESSLVDRLRESKELVLGLAAEADGQIVGYIALSALKSPERALALAPVGGVPSHQRRGVGGKLIEEALKLARAEGWRMIFVLGEPEYYGRFGFTTQCAARFDCEYAGPYFHALQLTEDSAAADPVVYSAAFADL
jgi:putative acetyltransferase